MTSDQTAQPMKILNPNVLLLSLCLGLSSCATAPSIDEPVPRTADEAFQRSVVVQADGFTVVRGPRVSLRLHGSTSYTGFQAVISPEGTRYYQRTAIGGATGSVDIPTQRADLDSFKTKGTSLNVSTGETVNFPPAYFIGFLRRVDSVRKH